jgi:integrase
VATATRPRSVGIERRTTAGGRARYRGVVFSKATGKRSGPWGSHAEAKAWRAKALGEIEAGTAVRSSPLTVRDAWDDFLGQAKAGTATSRSRKPFKPATLRGYERAWKRIDPELGAHRLTDIRRRDVQAMVDHWAAKGVAPSTIRNTLDPLRVLYRRALVRDLVTVNPTDGLEVPANRDSEPMRFADRAEAAALLAALPESERALWTTALYGGLRRGELRALRWNDVDLSGRLIEVRRSWDDKEGEQAPKTVGAQRRVPIVPALVEALKTHQRSTQRSGSDLVFGRTATEPFIPSTVRTRGLKAWEAPEPPLKPITLHQCRHTFASLMIASGANAKALSVVMGHATISITFDTYGKLMPGGEAEVGRLLANYLEAH